MAERVDTPEPEEAKGWTISVVLGPGRAQDVVAWRVVPDDELEEDEDLEEYADEDE
jgi:hypothetical protein